jgi:hypothetical protein
MLGHACEMLAVMYLQRGPPIAENETTTHRTHRTHRTHSAHDRDRNCGFAPRWVVPPSLAEVHKLDIAGSFVIEHVPAQHSHGHGHGHGHSHGPPGKNDQQDFNGLGSVLCVGQGA